MNIFFPFSKFEILCFVIIFQLLFFSFLGRVFAYTSQSKFTCEPFFIRKYWLTHLAAHPCAVCLNHTSYHQGCFGIFCFLNRILLKFLSAYRNIYRYLYLPKGF